MDAGVNKLSKNALKRELKRQRFEATRDAWKAKQKEKKLLAREKRLQTSDVISTETVKTVNSEPPIGSIIFDLSFEDLMSEKV